MYEFAYAKPASVADAVALLKADADAKPVSGGMTLVPTMKQRLARPTSSTAVKFTTRTSPVSGSISTSQIWQPPG